MNSFIKSSLTGIFVLLIGSGVALAGINDSKMMDSQKVKKGH